MVNEAHERISLAAAFMYELQERLNRELRKNAAWTGPLSDRERQLLLLVRRAAADAETCWLWVNSGLMADRSGVEVSEVRMSCCHLWAVRECVKCGKRHDHPVVPENGSLERVDGKGVAA